MKDVGILYGGIVFGFIVLMETHRLSRGRRERVDAGEI